MIGPMTTATWNGTVIAESESTEVVEGNHYFPMAAVHAELLSPTPTTTVCGWKGTASYYTITVDGQENVDAAWYYPTPMDAATNIRDHVAFGAGVQVA